MYSFSKASLDKLATCHEDLQLVCKKAIQIYDFSIICGHRDEKEQNKAYKTRVSQLKWPYSNHNYYPSLAVDLAPFPIDWDNINRFYILAGIVLGIAKENNINIVWGGNWKMKDYPHFELARKGT